MSITYYRERMKSKCNTKQDGVQLTNRHGQRGKRRQRTTDGFDKRSHRSSVVRRRNVQSSIRARQAIRYRWQGWEGFVRL